MNFHMFKLDLEKVEKPEIKLTTSVGLLKKQEKLTMTMPLTVWTIINCGKFFKRWEHQTT